MTSTETRTVRAAKKLLAAIPDVTPDHGLSPEMVETIATRLRDAYGKDDHWLAWCNDAHVILNIVAPEFRRIETLEKALERITTRFEKQRRASETWWPKPAREKNDRAIKAARAALSPPSDNSDAQAESMK